MSHFYGTIQGSRGEATRCGTKGSGMETNAASWEGAVQAIVDYRKSEGADYAYVRLRPWHGGGQDFPLYEGPVRGPCNVEELRDHVLFTMKQALRRGLSEVDLAKAMLIATNMKS